MRIIVATHNEGKLVEINRILEDCLGADADQVELVHEAHGIAAHLNQAVVGLECQHGAPVVPNWLWKNAGLNHCLMVTSSS